MYRSKFSTKLLFCLAIAASGFSDIIDTVEVRVAAFFPTSERFRDNFGWVEANYQLEVAKTFGCCCDHQIFLGVDWVPKSGSLGSCGSASIDILNGTLGYKRLWCCSNCFTPYLGVGAAVGYVWLENRRKCGNGVWKKHPNDFAVGGIARSGIEWNFCSCLFADLFVDYLFQWALLHRDPYIGGVRAGLGIGFHF